MNYHQKEEHTMNDKLEELPALRVLSLEDSLIDFEIIKEKLLSSGYKLNISHVEREKDFTSLIRNNVFDIILADFNLQGFDAFEALKLCIENCPDTPFICVSGSIGEITAIELLKLGAVDYVLKDRLERLPFAVKRALEEANEKKDRRKVEVALEKSEEKFRNIFVNHSAPKLLIDISTCKIVDANKAASQFYGWSTDELKKMKIGDINTASSEVIQSSMNQIQKNERTNFEFQHCCKDGSIKDVEIFSSKVAISGKDYFHTIVHDITAKKKAEQRVKILSLSIDQSPVSVTITDTDFKIEYVNPAFCKITGYNIEEVIGKTPKVFSSGSLPENDFQNVSKTIWSGNVWRGEFLNTKKNGEPFWENVSISPLVNEQHQITHFVSVKEDITEMRKMIEDLIASKDKAEASDRLKTAFMNNISHEIRTPLNGIVGFSQILTDEDLLPQERNRFIRMLNKSSDRLINTVTNFMDISLLNSGNQGVFKKEIDLYTIINNVIGKFDEASREKNLSISHQSSHTDNDLKIFTDGELISKIIYQLIDNAVKFTYTGAITLGYNLDKNCINLYVKDTGVGISEEKKNQMFGSFIQENISNTRGYEGSGIGLSIAKGFAELLGGKIWLESEKGKGSTFYLSIPCKDELIENKPTRSINHTVLKDISHTILIAEDDEINFAYLEILLTHKSIKVLHATNGIETVEMCKKNPEVCLVLMDLKMPEMDGFEATRQIKLSRPELPVIAVTAYAEREDKKKAIQAGCDDYLTKPVKKEFLMKKMEEFCQIELIE
jgi:PAS domain S-box-containing protein